MEETNATQYIALTVNSFVFTQKGPHYPYYQNTAQRLLVQCKCQTCFDFSCVDCSRSYVISLSSITGFLLYVCVLALLKFIGQFFYLLYHSVSWRQPHDSDSSLQKTGLFFWRKYIGVLTCPRTLWWLLALMFSMEALCGRLVFFFCSNFFSTRWCQQMSDGFEMCFCF